MYLYSLHLDDGGAERDVLQWFAHPLFEGQVIEVDGERWCVDSASLRGDWLGTSVAFHEENRGSARCVRAK